MILLIFPHQLFDKHPGFQLDPDRVVLIEDSLFFGDSRYPAQFHKQKLWLHRASMKRFAARLEDRGFSVAYLDFDSTQTSLQTRISAFVPPSPQRNETLCWADPTDFVLSRRLKRACDALNVRSQVLENPGFINIPAENQTYRASKKRWFMADFYKWQRRRLDVLMDEEEPVGGRWSFDDENRKKVPKTLLSSLPSLPSHSRDAIEEEAKTYVATLFPHHPGSIETLLYPTSHEQACDCLNDFLEHRFHNFGPYEDAIVQGQSWLWHSVLTPALNIGLLTPDQVLRQTLEFAGKNDVPLNSVEGFIRQIIGWREFMRATYEDLGSSMRTTNHWNHHRPIPDCFYDGTTGIDPVDDTIQRLRETGYCHHIERLMVLGGFLFLCEIDPNDIYRWFMEMFIDSYDWVMVPNVYAMSQHADGGSITTKPYFSGSSYIRKMSNHQRGPWCDVWDGLYWRWISDHAADLKRNPRWAMMCRMAEKMDAAKLATHRAVADQFLTSLS